MRQVTAPRLCLWIRASVPMAWNSEERISDSVSKFGKAWLGFWSLVGFGLGWWCRVFLINARIQPSIATYSCNAVSVLRLSAGSASGHRPHWVVLISFPLLSVYLNKPRLVRPWSLVRIQGLGNALERKLHRRGMLPMQLRKLIALPCFTYRNLNQKRAVSPAPG